MTRSLLLISLSAVSLLVGCDEPKHDLPPPPTTSRSDAVTAKPTATTPPATPTHVASTAPTAAPPRQLCAGQSPRPAPKLTAFHTATAPDATAPPLPPPAGVGKWTWINLWAAWCGPCREEMPRVIAWQKKLAAAGTNVDLEFVSLDDDERELKRLLESQPKDGLRASYWLPDGDGREAFLHGLGAGDKLNLPVQVFLKPSGEVACLVQGAVEDRDYPTIQALVSGR